MNTPFADADAKIRRSINQEFAKMEDDFDHVRTKREALVEKIFAEASRVEAVSEGGILHEDAKTVVSLYSTALKALDGIENAAVKSIGLKLKNQEQQVASAAAAKDRIEIVLRATAPGRIEQTFSPDLLEEALSSFDDTEIQEFELTSNPRDLSD